MAGKADDATWRYARDGGVVHAVDVPDDSASLARCELGIHPLSRWYGDGSDKEREQAARLPRCPTCLRAL